MGEGEEVGEEEVGGEVAVDWGGVCVEGEGGLPVGCEGEGD